MHVRTGSGAVALNERRQRRDRGDPGGDVVGKDGGRVIEAAGLGVLGRSTATVTPVVARTNGPYPIRSLHGPVAPNALLSASTIRGLSSRSR